MPERLIATPRIPRLHVWQTAGMVLLALWMSSPAAAQELPVEPPVGPRPLELLLEHREALALTDLQIERLSRIRERLVRTNEPLVRRMMTLRRQWQRQRLAERPDRQRLERIRTAAAPVHARIQANNRTAMQAVNRLLTGDQRARLRALVEERRRRDEAAQPPAADTDADARP